MIRYNIQKMLDLIFNETGKKLNLGDLSEKAGVNRHGLSRIINQPWIAPSTKHINSLIQYFFQELKSDDMSIEDEKNLMKEIVSNFITAFPDDMSYWFFLPDSMDHQDSECNLNDYIDQLNEKKEKRVSSEGLNLNDVSSEIGKKLQQKALSCIANLEVETLWNILQYRDFFNQSSEKVKSNLVIRALENPEEFPESLKFARNLLDDDE